MRIDVDACERLVRGYRVQGSIGFQKNRPHSNYCDFHWREKSKSVWYRTMEISMWMPEEAYERMKRGYRVQGSICLTYNAPNECEFYWYNYTPLRPLKVARYARWKNDVREDGTCFNGKVSYTDGPMATCSDWAQNLQEEALIPVEEHRKLERNRKQMSNFKNKNYGYRRNSE